MKKTLFIALLLCFGITCQAQRIYYKGSRIGEIKSDGDVYINGSRVGEFESDGDVYKNGSRIGEIESDGDVYYKGSRVGEYDGINRKWAAGFFFFFFWDLENGNAK